MLRIWIKKRFLNMKVSYIQRNYRQHFNVCNANSRKYPTPWSRLLPEQTKGPQSRNFSHFMKPEGLLPHSQTLTTCPYPEPDQSSHVFPSHSLKIPFNIIVSPTPRSSKWYFSLTSTHQNSVCSYPVSHTIWSHEYYLMTRIFHKTPLYVVFSTPLFSHLS